MKSESHCQNRPNLIWIRKFTLEANSGQHYTSSVSLPLNTIDVQNYAFGHDDNC